MDTSKKKGDQQFTDDGRGAETTVDLVLQEARAMMSGNKVNGIIARCSQERFLGQMEAPSSWKIVKLVFLRKPDAEPKKRIRSYRP